MAPYWSCLLLLTLTPCICGAQVKAEQVRIKGTATVACAAFAPLASSNYSLVDRPLSQRRAAYLQSWVPATNNDALHQKYGVDAPQQRHAMTLGYLAERWLDKNGATDDSFKQLEFSASISASCTAAYNSITDQEAVIYPTDEATSQTKLCASLAPHVPISFASTHSGSLEDNQAEIEKVIASLKADNQQKNTLTSLMQGGEHWVRDNRFPSTPGEWHALTSFAAAYCTTATQ